MFAKDVFKLSTGNALAQAISLVAIPAITRIYTPEEYGLFAICFAIARILVPVSNLMYHRAMMLPEDRNSVANLFGLSVVSTLGISLLLACAVFITNAIMPLPLKSGPFMSLRIYLWFVPLWVFLEGLLQGMIFWALKYERFRAIALGRVAQAAADRGIVLSLGFFLNPGAFGLILGRILGVLLTVYYLLMKTITSNWGWIQKALSLKEMRRLANRYRRFPIFSGLGFLLTNISTEVPTLFLTFFFSSTCAGFYALCIRSINVPMMVIIGSISRVFFQRSAKDKRNKAQISTKAMTLFSYLIYLVVPIVLVLIIFGRGLFAFIFGSEWGQAGLYAQVLSIYFFSMFLYRPFTVLFDVFELQRQKFKIDLCISTAHVVSLAIGAVIWASPAMALLVFSISTSVLRFAALIYLFEVIAVRWHRIAWMMLKSLSAFSLLFVFFPLTKIVISFNQILGLLSIIILFFIQSAIICFITPELRSYIRGLVNTLSRKC